MFWITFVCALFFSLILCSLFCLLCSSLSMSLRLMVYIVFMLYPFINSDLLFCSTFNLFSNFCISSLFLYLTYLFTLGVINCYYALIPNLELSAIVLAVNLTSRLPILWPRLWLWTLRASLARRSFSNPSYKDYLLTLQNLSIKDIFLLIGDSSFTLDPCLIILSLSWLFNTFSKLWICSYA